MAKDVGQALIAIDYLYFILWRRIYFPFMDLNPPLNVQLPEILSHPLVSQLSVLYCRHCRALFNYMQSHWSICGIVLWVIRVILQKTFAYSPILKCVLPVYPSSLRARLPLLGFHTEWVGNLVSFFSKWGHNFPSTVCWRTCLFSNACFFFPFFQHCQTLSSWSSVGLCVHYPILALLPWLWDQLLWHPENFLFVKDCFDCLAVCVSMWIFIFVYFCDEQGFWWESHPTFSLLW